MPEHLQTISKPFGQLATNMAISLPHTAETSAGLRKLLEAKDCAVRAMLLEDEIMAEPTKPFAVQLYDMEPVATWSKEEWATELALLREKDPELTIDKLHDMNINRTSYGHGDLL